MSTRRRSFVKAVTWETFSWFLTAIIAYLFSGNLGESSSLATACLILKIIFMFLHDRFWQTIKWGQ